MVKTLGRRTLGWLLRFGGNRLFDAVVRQSGRSAMDAALSAAVGVIPGGTEKLYTQAFKAPPGATVYLRASHCRVAVRAAPGDVVTLESNLQRAFGVEFASDQDEAGVYLVLRRKPVVGAAARIDLRLTVPPDAHLAFHLTPGDVVFENVSGVIKLSSEQLFAPVDAAPEQNPAHR